MSKILVVGYGYLGSHLVDRLRQSGHEVAAASKNGTGEIFEADLGSPPSIENLAQTVGKVDWVVHCASSSRGGADAYRNVFVEGIRNLTHAFSSSTIILTSSTSVYPQTGGETVTEGSPAIPDRETGQFLRTAEDHLLANQGIVLRLAGIYGPDRSVHLKKMLAGTATIESGEVSRWLNQIHRDDAAGAIQHIIENCDAYGHIYNVSDDHPITQRECYVALAEILNRPIPGESPPDKNRKRAWTHKQVFNTKLKATGWQPRFPSFLDAVKDDPRLLPSIEKQVSG